MLVMANDPSEAVSPQRKSRRVTGVETGREQMLLCKDEGMKLKAEFSYFERARPLVLFLWRS